MPLSDRAKKRLLITLASFAGLLLLALAGFLWKREQLLTYVLTSVKARVEQKYPARLTLGPARFTGLKTVEISGLSLVPTTAAGRAAAGDTLLRARRLQASLSLRSLFAGRPVFSDVQIDQARLTAHQTAEGNNFSFLLKKDSRPPLARDTLRGRNYGLLLEQVLTAGFGNVPAAADFRQFVVSYASPRHRAQLTLPQLTILDGQVRGRATATVDSVVNELGVSGSIAPRDYALDLNVFGVGGSVQVPYVARRFGALVSFDTVRVRLTGKDFVADDRAGVVDASGVGAARVVRRDQGGEAAVRLGEAVVVRGGRVVADDHAGGVDAGRGCPHGRGERLAQGCQGVDGHI